MVSFSMQTSLISRRTDTLPIGHGQFLGVRAQASQKAGECLREPPRALSPFGPLRKLLQADMTPQLPDPFLEAVVQRLSRDAHLTRHFLRGLDAGQYASSIARRVGPRSRATAPCRICRISATSRSARGSPFAIEALLLLCPPAMYSLFRWGTMLRRSAVAVKRRPPMGRPTGNG